MTNHSSFPNFPRLCFQRLALCLCITCQGQDAALSSSDLERQDDLSDVDFVAFAKFMYGKEWNVVKVETKN